MIQNLLTSLSSVWAGRSLKIQFVLSLIVLVTVLSGFSSFVTWVETRQGVVLADQVLAMLEPVDVTWLTFTLIYAGLLSAIFAVSFYPGRMIISVQAYTLMVLFRTVAMWATPLEAPIATIPLEDPLVEIIGTGQVLTRDLFFSGHTATMFILFLCVPQKKLKAILLVGTILLAACLLWQHVHYTVDVLAAPFFAYGAFRIVFLLHKKFKSEDSAL